MKCNYFDGKTCWVVPAITPLVNKKFEPSEDDKEGYCESTNCDNCPRIAIKIKTEEARH